MALKNSPQRTQTKLRKGPIQRAKPCKQLQESLNTDTWSDALNLAKNQTSSQDLPDPIIPLHYIHQIPAYQTWTERDIPNKETAEDTDFTLKEDTQ